MKYLRWFLGAVRPYRMRLVIIMACHILIAGCAVGFVYVSKKLVDTAVAVFSQTMHSRAIVVWALAMAAIAVFRILLNALRSYLQTTTDIKLKNRLRKKVILRGKILRRAVCLHKTAILTMSLPLKRMRKVPVRITMDFLFPMKAILTLSAKSKHCEKK